MEKSNAAIRQTLQFIKINRHSLTPQQYKTLKGQCLAGDVEGAKKGIYTILERK